MVVAAVEEEYSIGSIRQLGLRRYAHEALPEKRQHPERHLLAGKQLLGDARPGLEGEADWLSFCAASFADSAQSLSPRGSMLLMHEKPSGPKRRRAERRDAMPTLLHR